MKTIEEISQIGEGTFEYGEVIKHKGIDYATIKTAFFEAGINIMPVNPGTELYTRHGARTIVIIEVEE